MRRSLKRIGWDEAREKICAELRDKGRAESFLADMWRVTEFFGIVTGLTSWPDVDLESIGKCRRLRMAGGWEYAGRTMKAVAGRGINKDLATLSAFLNRAAVHGWIAKNPLTAAPDERIKVKRVRVKYMPDKDLRMLIDVAEPDWSRAFVIVAYYTGARRSDLLRFEWDTDIDFDGQKVEHEGRVGPHIFARGNKADTGHWMPSHPAAVDALRSLRAQPTLDRKVFPVRGSKNPPTGVSRQFGKMCVRAGLTEPVEQGSASSVKNLWSLHDLRKKANTDLRNGGASRKERMALIGQLTNSVNADHYEALIPARERELIDGLPAFGKSA